MSLFGKRISRSFPPRTSRIFLYFLGKTVASVHRRDLIAPSQATAMMRDRLLVNLLLAENGIRTETVNKRIGQHLSEEQMQCLQGVPAFGLSELSIREAQQSMATAYLHRLARSPRSAEPPGRWSSNRPPSTYGTMNCKWPGNG